MVLLVGWVMVGDSAEQFFSPSNLTQHLKSIMPSLIFPVVLHATTRRMKVCVLCLQLLASELSGSRPDPRSMLGTIY